MCFVLCSKNEQFLVAEPAGFKPATPRLGGKCSIQLSYDSVKVAFYQKINNGYLLILMVGDMLKYFVFICFSLAFSSISFADESYKAKIVGVTDGDTVKVVAFGEQIKVRLAGIDCPERKQPWGRKATEAVKSMVSGQSVVIEKLTVDRYGRTIARVFVDGVNVNRALVEGGHCWVYPRYATDSELFRLHDEAKAAHRGLWGLPESERVAPWEWRKRKR